MVVVAPLHEQQQTLARLAQLDSALVHLDTKYIAPFRDAPAELSDSSVVAFQAALASLWTEHRELLADTDGLVDALEHAVVAAAARPSRSARRALHADSAAAALQGLRLYWSDALRYHVQTRIESAPLFNWIGGLLGLSVLAAVSLLFGYRFVRRHGQSTSKLAQLAGAHQWRFQHHPLPMLELTPTYAIGAVNKAFEAWTGLTATTLKGQPADECFPRLSIDVPERRRQVEHVYGTEALVHAAEGVTLKADVYGMIMPEAVRGEVCHTLVFIDRTARHHAEERTAAQVAAREHVLNAIHTYAGERYATLGGLMERLRAQVKEIKPMLFPGREDALTALGATVRQSSRITREAQSWLQLQRVTFNTTPVDIKAVAQAALSSCAKRYGQVPIAWDANASQNATALAETSALKHVLTWGIEQACQTWQGTPWIMSTWASDAEVGVALQVKGANTMHVGTEASMGDGRSWALLAVEKMAGHLTVHYGPQGEQGFSLRLPRGYEQPAVHRNAA